MERPKERGPQRVSKTFTVRVVQWKLPGANSRGHVTPEWAAKIGWNDGVRKEPGSHTLRNGKTY